MILFLGCSKCLKEFTRDSSNRPDYSGYDTDSWPPRCGIDHKAFGATWLLCATKEEQTKLQQRCGVRFSQLFKLPYFDPILMHVIDPMHNLMLGVAKHTFKVWIELGVISETQLAKIDKRMLKIKVPSDIGRIARSLSVSYKSMKADEWKHWTLVYSMFSLQGVISVRDLNIWCLFVNACMIICKRSITMTEAEQAHNLLKMFCLQFQSKYGREYCVPNMHLMLHLKQCIQEYGSVYGFWCFGFERFNGIVGNYHTNNTALSIQVMRKFVTGSQLRADENCSSNNNEEMEIEIKLLKIRQSERISGEDLEFSCEKMLSVVRKSTLSKDDMENISSLFQKLYGEAFVRVSLFIKKLVRVKMMNEVISSYSYRGGKSPCSFVIARYPNENYNFDEKSERPAMIVAMYEIQIVKHNIEGKESYASHLIANLNWFKEHQSKNFYGINSPTKIWSTEYEQYSERSFLPLKFIIRRCVCCKEEITLQRIGNLNCSDIVNVVIPLPSHSILS